MLVVPTVQLMSMVSPSVPHQLSGKTLGKSSTGSRIPAVVAALPRVGNDGVVAIRTTPPDHQHVRPGFSTAPFVPPRR